jgi:hypothetical protein
MFYEVRIYNAKKELKKILSSQELSHGYWRRIKDQELGLNPGQGKVKSLTNDLKRQLDAQIPGFLPY